MFIINKIKITEKNTIANDLFKLEQSGNFAGRLEYINKIPDKYGNMKRKELSEYEQDLKGSKTKEEGFNLEEQNLIDDITFAPDTVDSSDVRRIGQDSKNREKLQKKLSSSRQKGDVQKGIEKRLKDTHTQIIEEAGSFWGFIPGVDDLSEEDLADLEKDYYNHLDIINNFFQQNPKASYVEAQDIYNKLIRPDIASKVIARTVERQGKPPSIDKDPLNSIITNMNIDITDNELKRLDEAFKSNPDVKITARSIKFALDQLRAK